MENQTNQPNTESKSLSLSDLFFIFKRNFILIAAITLVFIIVSAVYGLRYKPITYSTSATVMVRADSQSTSAGNYNDTVQSLRIMATVKDFITNDLVMEAAATDLVERMNVEKTERNINSLKGVIKGGLSLNSEEESLILTLYFSSNKKFLNETLLDEKSNIVIDNNIFVIEVINTVIEKAKEVSATTIETTDAVGNTKLEYKYAFVANNIQELSWSKTYSGSRGAAKLIIICTIIGAVVGYLIALLKYLLDDTFKTKEEIEGVTNIPVLAFIEEIQSTGGNR